MSFRESHRQAKYGDIVIIYQSIENMPIITLKSGESSQLKGGHFLHDEMVGADFGDKVYSKNKKAHGILLYPTPELWTLVLRHRTQILYFADVSMVVGALDLVPGSIVVESGTGSGSLSHTLLRAIAPTGHLHSYEFHELRAEKAREEFLAHGFEGLFSLTCRDVCSDGFQLDNCVDAVFLDLPKPWLAIQSGKEALKVGGRLCSFSPCMEQVQQTCETLVELGFVDVHTVEVLLRHFDVLSEEVPVLDPHNPDWGTDIENLRAYNQDRREKRTAEEADLSEDALAAPMRKNKDKMTSREIITARPYHEMRGHTGYLTFSTLVSKKIGKN